MTRGGMTKWVGLMVLVALAVGGCRSSVNQSTPKDTVRSMIDALKDGRKSAFMQCVKVADEHRELLGEVFDMAHAQVRLAKAMEKRFGEEFKKQAGAMGGLTSLDEMTDKMLDEMEFTIEGDKATCRMRGLPVPNELIKVDGKWYADATRNLPSPEQMKTAMEGMRAMRKVADEVRAEVGKPGQTLESIGTLYAEKLQEVQKSMRGF